MPRKPTRREQLFNEAVKRERAASRKINRIRNANGAKVGGTEFDPRANDLNLLRTMNGRELRSHIIRLNKFINRGTQFVAGVGGSPISRDRWQVYAGLQESFNAKARAHEEPLSGIQLPGQSGTIGSRNELMQPDNPRLANSTFRTFQPVHRQPFMVTDAKSLEKLIGSMRDKNSRKYFAEAISRKLNSAKALLRGSQLEEFIPELENMSVEQLDLLLNYSTFGDIAADRFASGTDEEITRDEHDRDYELRNGVDSRAADNRDDMERVIQWAKDKVGGPSEYTDTTAQPIATQFDPSNTNAGPITLPSKRKPGKGK